MLSPRNKLDERDIESLGSAPEYTTELQNNLKYGKE